MLKLVIFDFDGVIVLGTNEGYFTCYHLALKNVGVRLDPQEENRRILERWSQPYNIELEGLLIEYPELLPKAIKAYEQCLFSPTFIQNIRLIKGVDTSLKNLSSKYVLAIASGMTNKIMDPLIDKFQIPFFKKIVTNEDVFKKEDYKPAPFMINKLLSELMINKEEAVLVGDAKNDVVMAQNAGVIPIVVLTGHLTREEALALGVKYIIPDINHLEELLSSMSGL